MSFPVLAVALFLFGSAFAKPQGYNYQQQGGLGQGQAQPVQRTFPRPIVQDQQSYGGRGVGQGQQVQTFQSTNFDAQRPILDTIDQDDQQQGFGYGGLGQGVGQDQGVVRPGMLSLDAPVDGCIDPKLVFVAPAEGMEWRFPQNIAQQQLTSVPERTSVAVQCVPLDQQKIQQGAYPVWQFFAYDRMASINKYEPITPGQAEQVQMTCGRDAEGNFGWQFFHDRATMDNGQVTPIGFVDRASIYCYWSDLNVAEEWQKVLMRNPQLLQG